MELPFLHTSVLSMYICIIVQEFEGSNTLKYL